MRAEVSLEEYLRDVPAVVPPGESPFESTIQVPDGAERKALPRGKRRKESGTG